MAQLKSFPIYLGAQCLSLLILMIRTQYLSRSKPIKFKNVIPHKFLLFLSALPLFLLLSLRYQVGTDYILYSNSYVRISHYGLFEAVPSTYITWFGSGFVFFCKIIALFAGENVLWMFTVLAALSIMCLYAVVFENSKMPILSIYIYLCDGYYYQLFNQSRQGLALLIVFVSYKYIIENKFKPFVLMIFIASLFHASALIFLPAFFIAKFKFNLKMFLLIITAGMVLVNLWGFVEWSVSFTPYARYLNSGYDVAGRDITVLWVIYRVGAMLFCLLFHKKVIRVNPEANCLYMLCTCSLALQILSLNSYIFARTVLYYYLSMLLLMPYVVKSIERKQDRMIVGLILIIVFGIAHIFYFTSKADVLLAPVYQTFFSR